MDRGMKKWAPYKSLVEQEKYIHAMQKEKNKIPKPLLSNDEAERINDILVHYHGQALTIQKYEDGEIKVIETIIRKIDVENRCLILPNKIRVYLKDIVSIDEIN